MTPISKPLKMTTQTWLLLVILSLLWGSSFFFIKIALNELQPLMVVFARTSLAAILLLIFVYFRGQHLPTSPRLWSAFFVMGALNNLIPFSLIAWGQTHIDSSLAAMLNATTPVFTVVLAHFFTNDERLSWNRFFGVLCGLCGVTILIGAELLHGLNSQSLGQMAILGAAGSYSVAAIYGRRFQNLSPIVVATGMLLSTSVMLLPLLGIEKHTMMPSIGTWGALLGLALFSTAIAYSIYFQILAVAGATHLLLVTFLIPVSALILGVFVLHERVESQDLAGVALIFTGLAAIHGFRAQR